MCTTKGFPDCGTEELLIIAQSVFVAFMYDDCILEIFDNEEEAEQFFEKFVLTNIKNMAKAQSVNTFGELIGEMANSISSELIMKVIEKFKIKYLFILQIITKIIKNRKNMSSFKKNA